MSVTRRQVGIPDHILHNQELLQGIFNFNATPDMVRSDPVVMEALRNGEISEEFIKGVNGLPYFSTHIDASRAHSNISLENHFHPDLKHESEFYGSLDRLVKCVEKHPEFASRSADEQNRVCANEYKGMRNQAFQNELLYHNMHKRFFMDMLTYKRHEAPF